MSLIEPGSRFRNVLVLDSRAWFNTCRDRYDPKTDLVLTYDLALKREIEGLGGRAYYADRLLDREVMQSNNFLTYEFFRKWHFNASGEDLFAYKGIPFGFSLRIYFWTEYVFYVRARLCLETLREVAYDKLFAGTALGLVESILKEMQMDFTPVDRDTSSRLPSYYFPVHAFMNESIIRRDLKSRLVTILTWAIGNLLSWFDRALRTQSVKPAVFVQNYHPTGDLISRLKKDKKVRVVGVALSKSFLKNISHSRYVPLWPGVEKFRSVAQELLRNFRSNRCAKLILANGVDISEGAYAIIDRQVSIYLAEAIRMLDGASRYLEKNPIALEVMISNVGGLDGFIDSVCKVSGVPSFLIINGWLGSAFVDEGKYATTINAYSTSIKENYFRDQRNVVCLGDPRMDGYTPPAQRRSVKSEAFTVLIGASGFDNMDLNSHIAVEFDFMFDVLTALRTIKNQNPGMRIIIKVRANGYLSQYQAFMNEFFPALVDELVDKVRMKDVLLKSDYYISFYSQTLFEASCLGIPCVYYRNDRAFWDPPFDGCSELVTVSSVEDLVDAVNDFRTASTRYDAFLDRSVVEKYIGPLDGRNLERNLNYVYDLLKQRTQGSAD